MRKIFIFAGCYLCSLALAWSFDPYDALTALPSKFDHEPRVLNTEDVPDLRPHDPQELETPEGDFNKDGSQDIAVAGIYDLPEGPNKFFLLIATLQKGVFERLYYQEFAHPIFLHKAGTTGAGDPKTQAFSYTSCWDCEKGFDVAWETSKKMFQIKPWEAPKPTPTATPTPLPDVPDSMIQDSLKLIGLLPDVQTFVNEVNTRKGKLSTRVEWDSYKDSHIWVSIHEKTQTEETLFDKFLVDGKEKKILKRQRGSKGSK